MTLTTDSRLVGLPQGEKGAAPPSLRWFEQLSARDTDLAGGKGANLGELVSSGMPVPPGFVLTAEAFRWFLDASRLREAIQKRLMELDVDNTEALQQAAAELQKLVGEAAIPMDIRETLEG